MPLLTRLKFPGNSQLMNSILISIATFDLIPTDFIDEQLYYFPEEDPFNLNFQQSGYESKFFIANIGLILWIFYSYILLCMVYFILFKCKQIKAKIGSFLFWNGFIRLLFELFYEITLLSTLNLIQNSSFQNPFKSIVYSNALSIVFAIAMYTIPFFLLIFFCFKKTHWNSKAFKARYGAFLTDSDRHSIWS